MADTPTSDHIVTFASTTSGGQRSEILAAAGADVIDTIPALRLAVIRVPDGSSVIESLQGSAGVTRVEGDTVRAAEAVPSDPGYHAQWSLPRIGWDDVYGTVHPSGSAVVAVLDTGVDGGQPDLAGELVPGTSVIAGGDPTVDPNGHGTAMAGIIAAATNNGRGIAGIGFAGVKVMPVTVLDANGLGQDSDIIEGVVWAVDHGADVINMSFSNPGFSESLQAAIDYAWDHDVVVVAATGNDGSSGATYPAGDRGVVGVSSTDESDRLDPSSNHGADTFLGAPGEGILTLAPGAGTETVSGTSAASAAVAGAAGLLRAIDPSASNGVIVGRLGRSAADIGTRAQTGNGRLDLAQAVADDGTASVRPAGVGGHGGPFIGPYVAANKNLQITLAGGLGSGFVSFSNLVPAKIVAPCFTSCTIAFDNNQIGTLTATPSPGFVFVGWTSTFLVRVTTCADTTNPCDFSLGNKPLQLTATFAPVPVPVGTIDLQAGSDSGTSNSDDITNAAVLVFDVTFDRSVTGLGADDLSNVGTATGCVVGDPAGSGAAYTVTLTGCSEGTVVLRLAPGAVVGGAGGVNVETDGPEVTIDRAGPHVTIDQASGQPDPTGDSPVRFDVVFSETVSTFDAADVVITGTAGGPGTVTVDGSGSHYSVSVTGMTTEGTVIATIPAGATTGLAGNPSFASISTDNVVIWDTTDPSVTIDQAVGQADPTNDSPIVFTAVFTEPVTGFETGDVTLTGTAGGTLTAVVSGGPTTYSVTVTGMTTTGTVIASIDPGVAVDGAGKLNLGSASDDNVVLWDVTPPTVTIDQAAEQTDPTNASPITFTVVFSEAVVGFGTGDVAITGTSGGTKTATVTGGPVTFSVAVTGMTTSGTVIASIPAGVTTGLTGNPNAASTSTDDTVTWNRATHLAFAVQPTDTVYGANISPAVTVEVLDANDAVVTESSAPIRLTLTPAGANLHGTNPVIAVNGVATFSDLTVDQVVGDYTLVAQAPGMTSAESAPFAMLLAPLTVTANDQTKPYGTTVTFSNTDITVSGLVPGDTVDSLSLLSLGAPSTATVAGSPYAIVPFDAQGTGIANYDITYVNGSLTVTPATANIAVTGYSVPYDGLPHTATTTATGALGEDLSADLDLSGTTHTAAGAYPVDPWTFHDPAGNYVDASGTVADAIGATTLTITANSRTKPYGTTVTFAGTEFTVTGLQGTDTITSVTLTSAGALQTATVAASPYVITPSAAVGTGLANYTISYVPGSLTVTPATADIAVTGYSVPYDGLPHTATTTATGVLGEDLGADLDLSGTTHTAAGTYPVDPWTFHDPAGNYVDASGTVADAIGAATLTITANDRTKPYGTTVTFAGTEFTVTGLQGTDSVTSVTLTSLGAPATATVAGSPYAIAPSAAVGSGLANYTISYVPGNLTVSLAALTITANDRTKPYGTTVTFAGTEFTVTGLQGTDSVTSVTLTSAGASPTATVAGSPYPIAPSAAVGTGLANYTISYAPGALTVTAVTLTITANSRTKPYGTTVTFAGTEFTVTGLQGTDTITSVTLTSAGALQTATVAASPYVITPSAAVGTGLANYTISYVPGSLTVTPATADIAVTGYSVPYDGLPHTATTTATGVLGEDLSADLDLSGTTHTAAGTYPVDPWTFHDPAGNYVDASGTVADAIGAATLTITANDRTKPYGTTVTFAGTEFTVTGLQGTDSVTSVTLTSLGAPATATVAGSPYAIAPSAAVGSGLANYTISYVPGALTITPATLTIAADDQAKPSGVDFVFTGTEFSASGLMNADTVDSATISSAGAPASAPPGTYPIDISAAVGTGLANYAITYAPGTMSVGNTAPIVGDATVSTGATTPVAGTVPVNDPDTGQIVTVTISSPPAHGTATVAQDGSFTYTPTGTYTGRDTFTIEGCDDAAPPACDSGTVSIAIHPVAVDDAAVASEGETVEVDVQANDIGDAGAPRIVTGPAHGTASVGSIIYTPDPGFSGTDQVIYRICSPNDAAVCDDATLTVTVVPPGPATDVNAGPTTPIETEEGTGVLLVGLLAMIAVVTVGALAALGRRRT